MPNSKDPMNVLEECVRFAKKIDYVEYTSYTFLHNGVHHNIGIMRPPVIVIREYCHLSPPEMAMSVFLTCTRIDGRIWTVREFLNTPAEVMTEVATLLGKRS